METPERAIRNADRRPPEERKHPYMWADYDETPDATLTFDNMRWSLSAPYALHVTFFATSDRLTVSRTAQDDGLTDRHILADDVLIFDKSRTTPQHDAIMLVRDGDEYFARVCRVLESGWYEFHAAAPGFPILNGERKICGTLAAVLRCTDGKEDQS